MLGAALFMRGERRSKPLAALGAFIAPAKCVLPMEILGKSSLNLSMSYPFGWSNARVVGDYYGIAAAVVRYSNVAW